MDVDVAVTFDHNAGHHVVEDGSVREVTIECGTRGLATVLTRIDRGF
jgi:hypothetical protein